MCIDKTRCKEFVFTESNNFTFISFKNISCASLIMLFYAVLVRSFWYDPIKAACHDTLTKAFLSYNSAVFDNQCCIFFDQRIFSIITGHNISDVNFLVIAYWWHCRFLQFSFDLSNFLYKFTFYSVYIWSKILREMIPRMDDAGDSIKNPWKTQKQHHMRQHHRHHMRRILNVPNMHSFESNIRMQLKINTRRRSKRILFQGRCTLNRALTRHNLI